jgi:uncharacterized protein
MTAGVWQARRMSTTTGITVTGAGKAVAVPDVFVLMVGAGATSSSAAEATSLASAALTRIREAALVQAVPADWVSTSGLSLQQAYDREGRPRGVQCELALTIRSGNVAGAGELASACIDAAGDEARLQGIAFEHSDEQELNQRAREAAFADATERATRYAALAGRRLGTVDEVSEGQHSSAGSYRALAMTAPAAGIPISAGTVEVTSSVTVRWSWA